MSVRATVKTIQDIMRQDSGVDGDAQRISQLCWMFFLKILDDQDQQLELLQDGYRSPIPAHLQWRAWAADPEGITGDELLAFINSTLFPELKGLSVAGKRGERQRVVRDVFEDAYNYMKSGQLMRQVVNKINDVDFNDLAERQHFGDIYEQILNDLQSAGNAGEYYTPRAVTRFMADRIDPHPGEVLLDPACGTGGFLTSALDHMRKQYVKTVKDEHEVQAGLRAVEKKQLPHMLCVTNMLLHGIENPEFVRHDNALARPYVSYTASDRVDVILTNPPFGGREEDGIESNFPKHLQTRETADLFLALIIRLLRPNGRAAVVLPDGSLFGEGVKTRLKETLMEECNLHTIVRLPNSVFKPYATLGTNLLFFEKGTPTKEVWYFEHRVPAGQKAYSMTKPIRLEHFQTCTDWWGGAERRGREETPQAWMVTIDQIKASGYNLDIKNPHTVSDDHGDPLELSTKLNSVEAEVVSLRDQLIARLDAADLSLFKTSALFAIDNIGAFTVRPDQLNQLRSAILSLAVRGKLAAQDPNDEPASALLERIRDLCGNKTVRIPPKRPPFDLPTNWVWASLGELCTKTGSGSTPRGGRAAYHSVGVPFLRSQNVYSDGLRLNDVVYIDAETHHRMRGTAVQSNDLLLNITGGSIGRCCIVPSDLVEANISQHVAIIRVALAGMEPYLHRLILSPYFQDFILDRQTGAGRGGLPKRRMDQIPVALPPLAEQLRIVAAVDALMSLFDRLERRLTDGAGLRSRLFGALVAQATAFA